MVDETAIDWGHESLDRKKFGGFLLSCLRAEAAYANGSFVVALTAPFGSGKTHFLKAWTANLLQQRSSGSKNIPRIISINAWETDFSGEPLLAIMAIILRSLEESSAIRNQSIIRDLKTAGYGVIAGGLKLTKELALGYVEEKTGISIDSTLAAARDGSPDDQIERKASQLLSDFETRQRSLRSFKEALRKVISEETEDLGVLLVVDELDRCKPTYAVEFLEAIKHVFDVQGLGVLLAVDWFQLNATATTLFGKSTNSEEYLRKFIHRRAELPKPDPRQLERISDQILEKFFSLAETKQPLKRDIRGLLTNIIASIELTPRQIETVGFILARLYFYKEIKEGYSLILENRPILIPELFLACIHAKNSLLFDILTSGDSLEEGIKAICKLRISEKIDETYPEFIEGRILSGLATIENKNEFIGLILKYKKIDLSNPQGDEAHFYNVRMWPSKNNSFSVIGKLISEASSIIGF